MAFITIHRKFKFLGYYKIEEQAAAAYNSAAAEHFGEFARINTILP